MQSEIPAPRGNGATMQGHDGNEPLRELARHALCRTLVADARADRPDRRVRVLLRQACDVAHARDMHVEQVIIVLKEMWYQLPQPRRTDQREVQAALDSVISLCIEEYYAPRRSA